MLYITAQGAAQLVDDCDGAGGLARSCPGVCSKTGSFGSRAVSRNSCASDELLLPHNSLQRLKQLSHVLRALFERYAGGWVHGSASSAGAA